MGRRLAARLLDGLLFAPLIGLGLVIDRLPHLVLVTLVTAVYETTFVARDGQTFGKRWMGLRVVEAGGGAVPSLNQAALRWVVPEVATLAPYGLGLLLGFVVYLPILRGPLHRGLHDHVAGTVVTVVAPRHRGSSVGGAGDLQPP